MMSLSCNVADHAVIANCSSQHLRRLLLRQALIDPDEQDKILAQPTGRQWAWTLARSKLIEDNDDAAELLTAKALASLSCSSLSPCDCPTAASQIVEYPAMMLV